LLDECVSAPSSIVVFSSQKSPNESPKKRAIHGGKNSSGFDFELFLSLLTVNPPPMIKTDLVGITVDLGD